MLSGQGKVIGWMKVKTEESSLARHSSFRLLIAEICTSFWLLDICSTNEELAHSRVMYPCLKRGRNGREWHSIMAHDVIQA